MTHTKLSKKDKEITRYKELYSLSGKCFFDSARSCIYFDEFVKARKTLEKVHDLIIAMQAGFLSRARSLELSEIKQVIEEVIY